MIKMMMFWGIMRIFFGRWLTNQRVFLSSCQDSFKCCNKIEKVNMDQEKEFLIYYWDCLVFYRKKNKAYFEELIRKVAKRISSLKYTFIYFCGKYILINHVIQSIHVYLLSARNPRFPLKNITGLIHLIFAKYFWPILEV